MNSKVKKALEEAEKRLEEKLADIDSRHEKGVKQSSDEPDTLRSGTIDEVGLKRAEKEQEDDDI